MPQSRKMNLQHGWVTGFRQGISGTDRGGEEHPFLSTMQLSNQSGDVCCRPPGLPVRGWRLGELQKGVH